MANLGITVRALSPPDLPMYTLPNSGDKNQKMNATFALSAVLILSAVLGVAVVKFYTMCFKDEISEEDTSRQQRAFRLFELSKQKQSGLSQEVVNSLPTFRYDQGYVKDYECAVCLGDYEKQDVLKKLPPCGHAFHTSCIHQWLLCHHTCPICRISLLPNETAAASATGSSSSPPAAPVPQTNLNNCAYPSAEAPAEASAEGLLPEGEKTGEFDTFRTDGIVSRVQMAFAVDEARMASGQASDLDCGVCSTNPDPVQTSLKGQVAVRISVDDADDGDTWEGNLNARQIALGPRRTKSLASVTFSLLAESTEWNSGGSVASNQSMRRANSLDSQIQYDVEAAGPVTLTGTGAKHLATASGVEEVWVSIDLSDELKRGVES